MTRRGRLIVFEGGEGTGKSTQAELLARRLGAVLTREPGGTLLGEQVREIVLAGSPGQISPRAELLLFNAARAQLVSERIRPTLEEGTDVVCDRFTGSTLAYQGYGRGLPLEDVLVACELATTGLQADLTVLLELAPELARARRKLVVDRIEAEDEQFHQHVVDGFAKIAAADPRGWVRIDASGAVGEVESRVLEAVELRLGSIANASGGDDRG